jgi:hypothetical protein
MSIQELLWLCAGVLGALAFAAAGILPHLVAVFGS